MPDFSRDWADGALDYPPQVAEKWSRRVAQWLLPPFGALHGEPTFVGTVARKPSPPGFEAYGSSGSGTNLVRARFGHPWTASGANAALGVLVVFRTITNPASDLIIAALGADSGSSGNTLFCVGVGSSGDIKTLAGNATSNELAWQATGVSASDRRVHVALLLSEMTSAGSGQNNRTFVNGRKCVDASRSISASTMPFTWLCALGTRRTSDIAGPACEVLFTSAVVGPVTDAEAIEITSDWTSVFEPDQIYIPTQSAAAPTITALSARLITASSAQPRISYS